MPKIKTYQYTGSGYDVTLCDKETIKVSTLLECNPDWINWNPLSVIFLMSHYYSYTIRPTGVDSVTIGDKITVYFGNSLDKLV